MPATTPAQVEADISTVSKQVTTLDDSILAFPNTGGTQQEAKAIHNNVVAVVSDVNQTTSDTNDVAPKPVSEDDGNKIISALKDLEQEVEKSLSDIIAKKDAIGSLGGQILALVKGDLTNLSNSFASFDTALVAAMPSDLTASAKAFGQDLSAAFSKAIAAYS